MTETFCPYETQMAEAVTSGEWSDELRAHADECQSCGETVAVAAFMRHAAGHLGRSEPAPDPTLIWLKSELAARTSESKRERGLWFWAGGLTGLATALIVWAVVQWIPPIFDIYADTLTVAGASIAGAAIALTLGILYFAVYRPLRNVTR